MAKKYQEHYDCSKLINSLDADGEKPCFYIVCSHERGPGKTFQFSKLMVDHFNENGEKFILLTRNKGDLGNIAPGVLDSYLSFAHPDWAVTETIQMKGVFSKITLSIGKGEEAVKKDCGYVIPLRAADQIKKISSLFYDCWAFYMDEFQPTDTSTYLKDEISLMLNIYKSIARGQGSAVRWMPIYMASNTINLDNPYFSALGINRKIQENTRFTKGEGWIFENCDVEGLAEMHRNSPIEKALTPYLSRQSGNMWIGDDNSLVVPKSRMDSWGRGRYVATLVYNGDKLGLYNYDQVGLMYVSRIIDHSCQYIYNLTLDGGDLNIPAIKTSGLLEALRKALFKGCLRTSDGGIQRILLDCFL